MMVIQIIPVDVPEYVNPFDKNESTEQKHVPYFHSALFSKKIIRSRFFP